MFLGLIVPFIGTILGSAMVFLMREKVSEKIEIILAGFSSGVMIAASIWSLIIPSINISKSTIMVIVGIIVGIIFLIILNKIISKLIKSKKIKGAIMMFIAVTLHNIPEGMAVGASLIECGIEISYILSISIAIQNIPEGAIISISLRENGYSKGVAFIFGILSGIVEPIFGFLTIILTRVFSLLISYTLSFAAGAMIYVVLSELFHDFKKSVIGNRCFIIGFLIMMILDILL